MLSEVTEVAGAALPVQAMKDHLRLGTGFADDDVQDGLIETHLRAALAAIEGRIGKVLITRQFLLVLADWRDPGDQALPLAPVNAIVSVTLRDGAGVGVAVDPGRYRLIEDLQRPRLVPVGLLLPSVPAAGRVEIVLEAGFSAEWAGVPADLAQAVLLLAAMFYENRHDAAAAAGLPGRVMALIEGWRTVRVLGGGVAR